MLFQAKILLVNSKIVNKLFYYKNNNLLKIHKKEIGPNNIFRNILWIIWNIIWEKVNLQIFNENYEMNFCQDHILFTIMLRIEIIR